MCPVSQVPVTLVIFMHGGDVKLFLSPCAFMLNYAFRLEHSISSSKNTLVVFWCQEPTGQL